MQAIIAAILMIILMVYLLILNPGSLDLLNNPNALLENGLFMITLAGIAFAVSLFIFYIFVRFIHQRSFISIITTKSKINWGRILKGAVIWLAILSGFTVISLLVDPTGYKFTFDLSAFGILLIISLIAFPIQASFEELFFRGYLMQGFGLLSKKPIIPLLATSLIFGIMHGLNGSTTSLSAFIVLDTVIIGLMLGIITLGENSIETAIGIHIMNNIFVSLMVNDPEGGLGNVPSVFTAPTDPVGTLTFTVLAALIAIIIVFWGKKDQLLTIFKWEDV